MLNLFRNMYEHVEDFCNDKEAAGCLLGASLTICAVCMFIFMLIYGFSILGFWIEAYLIPFLLDPSMPLFLFGLSSALAGAGICFVSLDKKYNFRKYEF